MGAIGGGRGENEITNVLSSSVRQQGGGMAFS